jgi:hypothetical protein
MGARFWHRMEACHRRHSVFNVHSCSISCRAF